VFGNWLLGFLPERPVLMVIFVLAAVVGFVLALCAPVLTAAGIALAVVCTARRRDDLSKIVAMWGVVVLSIWSNYRVGAILKQCCT
jgi:hypothetical protein